MKFLFQEIKEFDEQKERRRIEKLFEGEIKNKLLKILDLFCEGKFDECGKSMKFLGYNKKEKCKEIGYVCGFIFDTIYELDWNENFSIEKLCGKN